MTMMMMIPTTKKRLFVFFCFSNKIFLFVRKCLALLSEDRLTALVPQYWVQSAGNPPEHHEHNSLHTAVHMNEMKCFQEFNTSPDPTNGKKYNQEC